MKHTISMQVYDEPGVMTRIAGLFARRGYNIETITVGKTMEQNISKIVITVIGDDKVIEQVEKQLNKLIDVIKVIELPMEDSIINELCLVKVAIPNQKAKEDILRYADVYKNKIVDITSKSITIRIIGEPQKIDTFLELVSLYGIKDVSRTGVTGMLRESPKKQFSEPDKSIGV